MTSFPQTFEFLGPLTIKLLAIVAGVIVFAPLVVAFAAPFVG